MVTDTTINDMWFLHLLDFVFRHKSKPLICRYDERKPMVRVLMHAYVIIKRNSWSVFLRKVDMYCLAWKVPRVYRLWSKSDDFAKCNAHQHIHGDPSSRLCGPISFGAAVWERINTHTHSHLPPSLTIPRQAILISHQQNLTEQL